MSLDSRLRSSEKSAFRAFRPIRIFAAEPAPDDAGDDVTITCASCRACCCRLEVILMGDDDVPDEMTESDRWGGQVMARLDDGWCAALDRNTMLCRIYERRPMVCREFQVDSSECLTEREK